MGGISDDLRLELIQVFALGFLDALAGFEVADSDVRMGIDPAAIESSALLCIAAAEDTIQATYMENPKAVHETMYSTGRWVYFEVERWAIHRN